MPDRVFQDTLRYTAPSHGDWGIVRMASLVPESYSLFVCPFACGRHGALGAIQQGFKDRLSYIFIDQKDIIEGYDKTIEQGVDELLRRVKVRPKVMMVFVSCLDDLIGTDLDSLMKKLHANHPDIQFGAGHMNPITLDTKTPPPVSLQNTLFGFLEPQEKEEGTVSLMGNLVRIDEESELYRVLKGFGMTRIRHISDYDTLEGYQHMARSQYNLVLSPIAGLAARNLEARLGTPFFTTTVSYDMDVIQEQYDKMAAFFGKPCCDLSEDIKRAEDEIKRTREAIGDTPIMVSSSATLKPFEMANALRKYGFRVASVAAQQKLPIDQQGYAGICGCAKIIQPEHPEMIQFKNRMPEAIAIGFDAGYISGSKHLVDLSGDQTMFGYYGVGKLMRLLREALEKEEDLKKMIDDYGVVI